jgi:acylphosphatase
MPESVHAILRGRVQGVGFRYFVLTRARTLQLSGFTRNLDDGTVEVYAEGERGKLEEFLSMLAEGPETARVETVESTFGGARRQIVGFYVR